MKRFLAVCGLGAMLAVPMAAGAHDYMYQQACASTAVDGAPADCVRVDTDTELEDGLLVQVDGDDSDPRGDGTSDGYVAVHVANDGTPTVYCEDEGHYNYESYRHGGNDETDEENPNDVCEL